MVKQCRVLIFAPALNSLQNIVDYLGERSSPTAALRIERKLLTTIRSLKTFPGSVSKVMVDRQVALPAEVADSGDMVVELFQKGH